MEHDELLGKLYDFLDSHPMVSRLKRNYVTPKTEFDILLVYNKKHVIIEVKKSYRDNEKQRRNQIDEYRRIFHHNPVYVLCWNSTIFDFSMFPEGGV